MEARQMLQEDRYFVGVMFGLSCLTAFTCGLLAVVLVPHWRRAAYAGVVLSLPIMATCLVATVWWYEAPQLFTWGLPYMVGHTGAQGLGGAVGILYGRAFARTIVRIIIPPSIRPRLAYLWLVDNKPAPSPG